VEGVSILLMNLAKHGRRHDKKDRPLRCPVLASGREPSGAPHQIAVVDNNTLRILSLEIVRSLTN
jgi:hypothetical protein